MEDISAEMTELASALWNRLDAKVSFGEADSSFLPVEAALSAWLEHWLAYQENFGTGPDERIRAAHLMTFYAHHLACVAATLFFVEGRVPALLAEKLFVRFEPFDEEKGRPQSARRFHFRLALPLRQGDEETLHDGLVESLAPVVAALNKRSGLSTGSLWRLASDGIFGAFLDIGRLAGWDERVVAAGLAIVEKDASPFRSGSPRVEHIRDARGVVRTYRLRSGCCLAYRAEGGSYCDVCVLLPAEERQRRLSVLAG